MCGALSECINSLFIYDAFCYLFLPFSLSRSAGWGEMHECKQSEMALALALACADTYTLASHRYDVNEIWVFSVRSPALGGCVCIHNIDVRSVRTVVATLAFAFTMVSFE